MDLRNDFIEFTGFGKVKIPDLLSIKMGEEIFWSILSESITLKELNDGARGLNEIFTTDNHKFTLIFWKGILSWQEIAPGPETEHFISMLGHTIRLYLSWDLNDQNIFKILRFLAAGFHKLVKLKDNQEAVLELLYKLHQTGGEESVATFILLFRNSMSKLVKPPDSDQCGESGTQTQDTTKYHVVQLLDTLETVSPQTMSEVFQILGRVQLCSAIAAGIVVYWEGRYDRPMSLIHRAIYKLSSLCTQIRSSENLKAVEFVLVKYLLSYNYLQIVVSSNVLVFLARLAPPQYVVQLVRCLCDLAAITHCQIRSSSLKLVISRLLPIMDQSELVQLQSKFTLLNNGLLSLLKDGQRKEELAKSVLLDWKSSKIKTGELLKVVSLCSNTLPTLTELSDLLLDMPKCRQNQSKLDNIYCLVVQCLESVRENWREYRNNGTVLQLFQLLDRLISLKDVLIYNLILDVVSQFSSYSCTDSVVFCYIASQIFSKLIKSTEYPYLEKKCLFVIATFAKMTPHPELLTSLAQDPDLKSKLTSFLQHKVLPSDFNPRAVPVSHRIVPESASLDSGSALKVIRTSPGERLILHSAMEVIQSYPQLPLYAQRLLSVITS